MCEPKVHRCRGGKTYPDHRQDGTDGAKYSIGWRDARDLLREIEGFDGHIQCGDDTVPPLWSFRIRSHG